MNTEQENEVVKYKVENIAADAAGPTYRRRHNIGT